MEQKFDVAPSGGRVLFGGSYNIHCKSTGIPPPKISWYFEHATGPQLIPLTTASNNNRVQLLQNGSLALKDVTLGESGVYYCVSDSPGYRVNASANVQVYGTIYLFDPGLNRKL